MKNNIDIRYRPNEIREGMTVKLSASTSDNVVVDEYRWRVDGVALTEPPKKTKREQPNVILWNTSGLQSRTYRISVEAGLAARAGVKGSVATKKYTGEINVQVRPRHTRRT
jgi:hypothetical protein